MEKISGGSGGQQRKMTTLQSLLEEGRSCLEKYGIADAATDSWLLLSFCFGVRRLDYLIDPKKEADPLAQVRYEQCIKLRAQGTPLQYITGEQEFMGLSFKVNEHVLIPRQDTEILVETVIKNMPADASVLDMCTGSGCILLSIMAYKACLYGDGADLSVQALKVAEENEKRIRELNRETLPVGQCPRVRWIHSDLFEHICGRYDVIVSNPPYIPSAEISELMTEVRSHEPHMALDGSDDGLAFYRRIAAVSRDYLTDRGMIFFEIGWNQAEDVSRILEKEGFCQIQVKKDLAGLDRVVYASLA